MDGMLAGYIAAAPSLEQLALIDLLLINSQVWCALANASLDHHHAVQGDNEDIIMAVNPASRPDFGHMSGA
jgi:hypothetical protein